MIKQSSTRSTLIDTYPFVATTLQWLSHSSSLSTYIKLLNDRGRRLFDFHIARSLFPWSDAPMSAEF